LARHCGGGSLTSGTYTVSWTEADDYPNTASVTAKDNEGNADTATDTETVYVTDVLPDISNRQAGRGAEHAAGPGACSRTRCGHHNSVEPVTITAVSDTTSCSRPEALDDLIGQTKIAAGGSLTAAPTR